MIINRQVNFLRVVVHPKMDLRAQPEFQIFFAGGKNEIKISMFIESGGFWKAPKRTSTKKPL